MVDFDAVHRLWRAANDQAAGQIYLRGNPLLRQPLAASDIKPRLFGHWGTTPGINLVYAHLQRLIVDHGTPADRADPWRDDARLVDRATIAALTADAEILIAQMGLMDGPQAALRRW